LFFSVKPFDVESAMKITRADEGCSQAHDEVIYGDTWDEAHEMTAQFDEQSGVGRKGRFN
jgi:hypothetical protein